MSLYDEYESVKQQAWMPGINFLESHLRTKKASSLNKADSVNKSAKVSSTLPPVINLQSRKKSSSSTQNEEAKPSEYNSAAFTIVGAKPKQNKFYLDMKYHWGYDDEYDPFRPCDYYKVRKELETVRENKEKLKKAAEVEMALQQEQLELLKQQTAVATASNVSNNANTGNASIGNPGGNGAVAPATSSKSTKNFLSNYGYDSDDCSGDEKDFGMASRRNVELAPPSNLSESDVKEKATSSKFGKKCEEVAAKIMAKYGFKEGSGLGKDNQGMSTALQVQRTIRNCGRILHENDFIQTTSQQPSVSKRKAATMETSEEFCKTDLLKNPSKIVLLSNMVGPGEVDDDLEREIKDECNSKYGEVVQVLIYERTQLNNNNNNNSNAEDAVRVFVEFKRPEIAMKAVVDLNGRYFGGRTVKASFYDVDKYNLYQLNE